MKTCSICGEPEGKVEFGKNRARPDGYQYECKTCRNTLFRQWAAENAEQNRKHSKDWRAENQALVKVYKSAYKKNNPLKNRQWNRKRTALKRNATVGIVSYEEILVRDKGMCHICGCSGITKRIKLQPCYSFS